MKAKEARGVRDAPELRRMQMISETGAEYHEHYHAVLGLRYAGKEYFAEVESVTA